MGDFLEHYFTNNQNLRSEIRTITYENQGTVFTFFSDLGVFSKDHIDFGSKTLVDTILKKKDIIPKTILDVGCGYGFLGIVLGKLWNSDVTMVDVNKRALHLCEKNISQNKIMGKCFLSDAYQNVQTTFDLIITNPPIRAGKKVVLNILENAKDYLNQNGELWFVIRKDQGAKSIQKQLEETYKIEIEEKEKGFYIMCAKMN